MKKITLLLFALVLGTYANAQCINAIEFLTGTATDDGQVVTISTCMYSEEFNNINGLTIGNDYEFTGTEAGVHKYITITDAVDVVIAHGMSPLTVNAVTVTTVRIHVTEDAACATAQNCHVSTVQCVSLVCAPPPAPECATAPITPVDGATGQPVGEAINFSWTAPVSGPAPTSYNVYAGGMADGSDQALVTNVTATNVDLFLNFFGTTTYWSVRPLNDFSEATGCALWSVTTVDPPPAPANDECDNAVALTVNTDFDCDTVTPGTTVSATASAQADDVTGTPDNDVWFSFVATGSDHSVSLLNLVGITGGTDMGMGVYDGSGTCAGLVFTADSDPNSLNLTGLTNGVTYYVRVYGWGAGPGAQANFDICIGTPPPAPANDNLCNATALSMNSESSGGTYTSFSATAETGEVEGSCFNAGINGSVWFTFDAPASGEVRVSTDLDNGGTHIDTEITVYAAPTDCNDASTLGAEQGCDQDGGDVGNGWLSTLDLTGLTSGETYYIQVDRWGTATDGSFDMFVSEASLSIPEVDANSFKYFPNPVNDNLSLRAQSNIQNVAVYNMLGQEVMKMAPNAISSDVDMSNLSQGAYFVKVTINDMTETIRIIRK